MKRSVSGASTLNGCTPVNRIKRGSRGTWWSGVSLSKLRTSLGPLDDGGNGMSTSGNTREDNFSIVVADLLFSIKMEDFREWTLRGVRNAGGSARVAMTGIVVAIV